MSGTINPAYAYEKQFAFSPVTKQVCAYDKLDQLRLPTHSAIVYKLHVKHFLYEIHSKNSYLIFNCCDCKDCHNVQILHRLLVLESKVSEYTLFQNSRHFSILLFPCKLALLASLSSVKFRTMLNLKRGQKGQIAIKQKNTKKAAVVE